MILPPEAGRLTEITFSLPLLEKETTSSGWRSLALAYLLQNKILMILLSKVIGFAERRQRATSSRIASSTLMIPSRVSAISCVVG